MGGIGSGQYYRWGKRTNTDNASRLDINRMVKQGAIPRAGWRSGSWIWSDKRTGEQSSSIGYEANTTDKDNSYLRVYYTIKGMDKKMDYKIPIVRTQPNYGGERFWFICPVKGVRVSKLYLPYGGDMFASRQAYRLKYGSQSETFYDRALRKKWKLLAKFDDRYDFPMRPKGMHQKTYKRLRTAYVSQDFICEEYLIKAMERYGFI